MIWNITYLDAHGNKKWRQFGPHDCEEHAVIAWLKFFDKNNWTILLTCEMQGKKPLDILKP